MQLKVCAVCGNKGRIRCSCRIVYYCSDDCKREYLLRQKHGDVCAALTAALADVERTEASLQRAETLRSARAETSSRSIEDHGTPEPECLVEEEYVPDRLRIKNRNRAERLARRGEEDERRAAAAERRAIAAQRRAAAFEYRIALSNDLMRTLQSRMTQEEAEAIMSKLYMRAAPWQEISADEELIEELIEELLIRSMERFSKRLEVEVKPRASRAVIWATLVILAPMAILALLWLA